MKLIRTLAIVSMFRILVLALLSSGLYYAMYFDDGSKLEADISAMNTQVDAENARRVEVNKIIKKEEEMRGNLLQLQRNLEVVKSKIPNEFKDTQMSLILNNASVNSGISLVDLSVVTQFNQNQQRQIDPNSIKPEDLIEEVKFRISLTGSYESFLKFLDYLTKEDKVLKVRNFSIEKNSTDIDDDTIKFNGEVVGFKQSSIIGRTAQGVK